MKKIAPILLVIVIVAGVVLWYRRSHDKPNTNQLRLSGNIEAHESVIGFKVQGRIVELPVEEGQQVKAGDLLARLDDDDFRQQVQMDQALLHTRAAELQLATSGGRKQDVAAAEQAVVDAKADMELKRVDLERYESLFAKEAISAQTRDQAKTAYDRSKANHARLVEQLGQIKEGPRKEQIAVTRATVNQANQTLGMSKLRLQFTKLSAPRAGIVTVKQAEVGEVVSPGSPVVTVADVENVWLRAYVAETDLGRVHWGQEVTVKTDTYPDKTYKGRISFISPQAEFTPKSVETHKERVTLVYRIKIDLENSNLELKPGMPADALIDLAQK